MKEEIKKRIEAVRRGEVPEGYCRTKDIGISPCDWPVRPMADIVHNEQRPVPKPNEPYWRLGVRSWAKGTFHTYVDDPSAVDMDELYVVKKDDLIVNITFAWEHAIAIANEDDDGLLVSHRFPTYVCNQGNIPAFYKAIVSQKYFKDMLDHISPGGAGRNRVLNRKDFLDLPCYMPKTPEQQKIAEILATCDKVIELKQKLIEELLRLKKLYMKKMFPQKGKVVPEIRFPGFTEPWEQRKFYNVFSFLQNNTLSRTELSEERGAAKNVHYGDVLIKFGEYLDVSKEQFAFIPAETVAEKFKSSFLQNGDIIIADTAEDETVGKCCEIANSAGIKIVSGLHTMPCRPNQKYASGYLGYYMNSPAYHDQLLPLMQGTKVTSVSKTAISGTVLTYPASEAEQRQISQYFLSIDNIINLYQRELEEEQRKKKALMQLLLTGLVRVKV